MVPGDSSWQPAAAAAAAAVASAAAAVAAAAFAASVAAAFAAFAAAVAAGPFVVRTAVSIRDVSFKSLLAVERAKHRCWHRQERKYPSIVRVAGFQRVQAIFLQTGKIPVAARRTCPRKPHKAAWSTCAPTLSLSSPAVCRPLCLLSPNVCSGFPAVAGTLNGVCVGLASCRTAGRDQQPVTRPCVQKLQYVKRAQCRRLY
jgi:hypothetical protein